MRPAAWCVGVVLSISLCACHNRGKEDLAKFNEAQTHFINAERAVRDGKLDDAHDQYESAMDLIHKLRRSTSPPMSEEEGNGPMVAGFLAKDWEARWKKSFSNTIETEFENLQARAAQGTLDYSRADAFIMSYRRDLEPRWSESIGDAAKGQVQRLGDTYFFECLTVDEDACTRLYNALVGRLAKPLTRERAISGNARTLGFGIVSVSIEPGKMHAYEHQQDSTHNRVYELPAQMNVTVKVETHRGQSTWDGAKTYTAEAEPPVAVLVNEQNMTADKHYQVLYDAVIAQLNSREKQVLSE